MSGGVEPSECDEKGSEYGPQGGVRVRDDERVSPICEPCERFQERDSGYQDTPPEWHGWLFEEILCFDGVDTYASVEGFCLGESEEVAEGGLEDVK